MELDEFHLEGLSRSPTFDSELFLMEDMLRLDLNALRQIGDESEVARLVNSRAEAAMEQARAASQRRIEAVRRLEEQRLADFEERLARAKSLALQSVAKQGHGGLEPPPALSIPPASPTESGPPTSSGSPSAVSARAYRRLVGFGTERDSAPSSSSNSPGTPPQHSLLSLSLKAHGAHGKGGAPSKMLAALGAPEPPPTVTQVAPPATERAAAREAAERLAVASARRGSPIGERTGPPRAKREGTGPHSLARDAASTGHDDEPLFAADDEPPRGEEGSGAREGSGVGAPASTGDDGKAAEEDFTDEEEEERETIDQPERAGPVDSVDMLGKSVPISIPLSPHWRHAEPSL